MNIYPSLLVCTMTLIITYSTIGIFTALILDALFLTYSL